MMIFRYGVDFMPGLRSARFGCCPGLHSLWKANLRVAFRAYLSACRPTADASTGSAAAEHPKGRAACNNFATSDEAEISLVVVVENRTRRISKAG
jgi:hypothetical protein